MNTIKLILISFISLYTISINNAQSLTCGNAEVLCSLGDLDDFTGTMPSSNIYDEPAPFCNGTGNPQNMSWFAFIAGSSSAVLELVTSNCNSGTSIQYGIYTDCSYSESIICQGNAVNANGTITLNLNGMVPGDDYFFFIDGDLGTYCDYGINVVSGGEPVPVPQPTGINCISNNCPTDNAVCLSGDTYTFQAAGLNLTIDYLWSITPLPPGYPANPQTINGSNAIDLSFSAAGDYSICLQATNGCTTTDEVCIDFVVFEADAGQLMATPNPLCPGETSSVTVTDYTTSAVSSEKLIVVGPDGIIIDVADPPSINVTYDQCGIITVYSYNYITSDNPGVPTVGSSYSSPDCNAFCCDTKSIEINFEDTENPSFVDPPQDVTMDCNNSIPTMEDLTWLDNCSGTGTVSGTETQNYNTCNGGSITRTWTFTDDCMNTVEHTQTITLNPAPPPVFINPPANETLDCDQVPGTIPTLTVSNNQTGACLISGTVEGTETSTFNTCDGGVTTRTWSFTDECGNNVEFVQTITINPPPEVSFIDPPTDITVNCDELPTNYPSLNLSNGQTGNCLLTGTIAPTVSGDPGTCGGNIDVIWIYTDECNRVTSHVQIITVLPAATPSFANPPENETISCVETLPIAGDLDYSNGETGACMLTGTITPVINSNADICGGIIVNTWQYTDDCNQTLTHTQTIIVEPPTEASFIDPPTDINISCDQVPPNPSTLSYNNGEMGNCQIMGSATPTVNNNSDICGGTITNTWEFIDECARVISHTQTITVEPAPEAIFVNPPTDITINCNATPPSPPILNYTNNETGDCEIAGAITASVQDNSNSCGGNIIYTWEYTDPCSRTITHTQTVTITEAPVASFLSLPIDETISCTTATSPAQPLAYSNNDDCSIVGTVDPIIVDNTDICGGTITNTWDFTDECGRNINHEQIITKEPASQASFVNPPSNGTVACGDNATTPADLNYTNEESGDCEISGKVPAVQSGSYNACGGDIIFTWEFIDACQRVIQHVQTIVVEPSTQASFTNPPPDITVNCADFSTTPPNLSYTNGESDLCEISGEVPGTLQSTPNPCGTTVQYRWEFTDECGRTITHTQNITIEEAPQAAFLNPPTDMTVDCNNVPTTVPSLSYTNNANGICDITGSVNGIQSGSYDECGGSISYTWTYTDECNRVITHNQSIIVNPAADPIFINPPNDLTLGCDDEFPINPTLNYSNSESGNCSITGTVVASSSTSGNITSYTWEYTNTCNGNIITHTQNITGVTSPDISISPTETAICYGSDFDLSTIIVTNQNANNITIKYQDDSGNPIANPSVSPTQTTIYTIVATNDAGCSDEAYFTINIDNPPIAGIDGMGKICDDNQTHNLFDFLNGAYEANGTWYDTDNSGANIDNPNMADFSGVSAGIYNFTYTVFSSNSCPDASAVVTIEFIEELAIEILLVECEPNGSTYHINVSSDGNTIISTAGDVTILDANNVVVNNIPSGQSVIISAYDTDGLCNTNINVNAPDCDCPDIPAPLGNDIIICEDDDIPALTVTVNAGFKANWYDSPTGTTALVSNSLSYIPMVTAPGTYTYYVEAENPDGCVSLIRTPIKLTINAAPVLNVVDIQLCADENGNIQTTLSDHNSLVNSNANFTFTYYGSMADAENNNNPLNDEYIGNASVSLFVKVENTSGCVSIAIINLVNNPLANYQLVINNETCLNENNGNVQINNITPSNTRFSLDNITYDMVTSFTNLQPGNYTLYSLTENDCSTATPFTILEGLNISYSDLAITCNDNDTNTDSTDDYYIITFTIDSNQGLTDKVNISIPSHDYGSFDFGTISIEIPAGAAQTITIQHPTSSCSIEILTGDLNPCSSSCSITIDEINLECNGNDTPTDPSDDSYQISVNASVINGAANNSFNVVIDGVIVDNFIYGTGGTISIPAQGQTITLSIVDNEDNQCFANQVLGPLNSCSDVCLLTIDNQNFICDNHSTIGVPEDDTYTFSFIIQATNSNSTNYNLIIDGLNVGTYDYDILSSYTMSADGNTHDIKFIDASDSDCNVSLVSPLLESCSGTCSVTATLQAIHCNNQFTADNELDDTYTADIKIDLIGGTGQWTIASSGQSGTSGQTVTLGPFLITDGSQSIVIADSGITNCNNTIELIPPPPCSSCEGWAMAGADVELDCDVTEATLSGTSSASGNPLWTGPGGFSSQQEVITINIAGTYIYSVDLGEGCIKSDTLEVSVSNDIPNANAGLNQSINCLQDSVVLIGTVSGGSGNFTYKWLDADMVEISTKKEIKVGESGNYFFVVYDIDTDCTSPASIVEVTDDTQNPSAVIHANPGNELDCVVELIYLTNNNEPNTQYFWYVDNILVNDEIITIIDAALVKLIAKNIITGCEAESELNIPNLQAYPIISILPTEQLSCNKSIVTIDASQSQIGDNISYTWSDEQGNTLASNVQTLEITEAGTYYLELMDTDNSCTNVDTIVVSGSTELFEIDLNASITAAPGQTIQLEANVNINPDNISSIQWSPVENLSCATCLITDLIVGNTNQTYTVVVTDTNGCVAEAKVLVISHEEVIITIPNIFSPERDDGQNMFFTAYSTDENARIITMSIYDRWGGRLYKNTNIPINEPSQGWNGKFRSASVQPGVYMYHIEIKLNNGDIVNKVGDLTVVR